MATSNSGNGRGAGGGGNGRFGAGPGGGVLSLVPGVAKKYDEAKFLVGGRGTHGSGEVEKEWFKLHEGYVAEARRWVDSGVFPFRTITDVYRFSVVFVLTEVLPALEPLAEDSVLQELQQIDEIVAQEEFQARHAKSIDRIAKAVNEVLEVPGGKREAARMLRSIKKRIDKMRPGFWRTYYERQFDQRFGPYLNIGLVLLDSLNGTEEPTEDEEQRMLASWVPPEEDENEDDNSMDGFGEEEP